MGLSRRGILSDSGSKISRKVRQRTSICFDANTKRGDDEESYMPGVTSPVGSIIELCGDVRPEKQDYNFAKVAKNAKKDGTPLPG